MDDSAKPVYDFQNVLRLSLIRDNTRHRLNEMYGATGDYNDYHNDPFYTSQFNDPKTETRAANSRYRDCWEDDDEIRSEDELIDELAHRTILSATMNDDDDEEFGIARPFDKTGRKPLDYSVHPKIKVVPIENLLKEKYRKSPNKLDRKIRRVKSGQISQEDVIYMAEEIPIGTSQPPPNMPPGPTICLPLVTYRRMIAAELIAESRVMQDYFNEKVQVSKQQKEAAMRARVYYQTRLEKVEKEAAYSAEECRHLRSMVTHLRAEIASLKEAKRRRRSAKKHRNRLSTGHSSPVGDALEGDDEAEEDGADQPSQGHSNNLAFFAGDPTQGYSSMDKDFPDYQSKSSGDAGVKNNLGGTGEHMSAGDQLASGRDNL